MFLISRRFEIHIIVAATTNKTAEWVTFTFKSRQQMERWARLSAFLTSTSSFLNHYPLFSEFIMLAS